MRKIETLLIGGGLICALTGAAIVGARAFRPTQTQSHEFVATKYGAFLAAQHAIYVNDFDTANQYMNVLSDVDHTIVAGARTLTQFLGGKMPENAAELRDEKSAAAGMIYDAHLAINDKWKELYSRHKKDASAISAPVRIWSAVASGNKKEALAFVDKLSTNAAWKSFMRGQIYAQTGDVDKAAAEFAKTNSDFMNIGDYLYVMSFYMENEMDEMAGVLHDEFTERAGGMFLLDFDAVPDWKQYAGYKNALAFSMVQTVSHTQIMMFSDLALLFLRFAQIVGPAYNTSSDAINYYLGQYFYNNNGDWAAYYSAIPESSPYYLFGVMRAADKNNDFESLARAVRARPLFIPGAMRLVAHYTARGDYRAMRDVIQRGLDDKNLTDNGRAQFLKMRARANMAFGNIDDAQDDIRAASDIIPTDAEIFGTQAKIWAAKNRELDNAYEYAMKLVSRSPSDVAAWDVLSAVVAKRESPDNALELLERVGDVANSCSALFAQLGDLYAAKGDNERARNAYMRAIDLAEDGLVVIPHIEKKLRKLK